MIIPPKLKAGDTIAVVSPSSAVASFCPRRLQRGIDQLQGLGFNVKLGKNATNRYKHTAGTMQERLDDIHEMFSDSEVNGIICTIGGLNSHHLLEGLDYELIKNNPKVFMGYSDITALLNVITHKTGMITYHGPMVLPQFGEFDGIFEYSLQYFKAMLMNNESVNVKSSKVWTDEMTWWDKEDDRPRVMKNNPGMITLKEGAATGQIVGGNVGTLLLLAGTTFWPAMNGKIFFVEEDEEETPGTIDRYFTQLRHMGVYDQIAGLVVGRFHTKVGFTNEDSAKDIILTATAGYDFPIIKDVDFGHTDPVLTIPIGGMATISKDELNVSLN